MERRPVYFNEPQRENMIVGAKNTYIIASRGLGKSEGVDAVFCLRNMLELLRCSGGFVSPTYSKALQNTLPAICHAFAKWGYLVNRHYYVGVRPPKSAGFQSPYIIPFDYDNVMSFYNGSIMHILSLDRAMSANSMSLDWLLIAEAKYIDYKKFKSEVMPANRGNRQYFDMCPWHHGVLATTDMPTSNLGNWIFEKKEEMDAELIAGIKSAYSYYKKYKESSGEHGARMYKTAHKDLCDYRRNATFYAEYSVIDHFEIVGAEWINQMKKDLPPLLFRTSICNERILKAANGFYSALDERLHFYVPQRDSGRIDLNWQGVNCLGDADLDMDAPLWLAFDSNAAINTAVAGQVRDGELVTLKSFFVKTPMKLPELVQQISDYYKPKTRRNIVLAYDSTFAHQDANNAETFADSIIRVLRANDWEVDLLFIGKPKRHMWKHKEIDRALKGDSDLLFPRFNLLNNEYLKLALEQAGVRVGRNGFEKDKSVEHRKETEEKLLL